MARVHATYMNVHTTKRGSTRDNEIVAAPRQGRTEHSRSYTEPILHDSTERSWIYQESEDAEDALQDTFLHACLAIHAFKVRASVYSWLTRIAINSALLILRKRRVRAEILFDPQPDDRAETFCLDIKDPAPNPEQVCDLRQRRMRLQAAIRNLNARQREPIRMRMAKESSLKEISRSLNISEGAVKARLHRARMRLSATWWKPR